MATSSSNLKSTFKRHIREGSDLQTAAAMELFKELFQRAGGRSRAGEPLKKRLAKLESTLLTNSRTAFKENRRPVQDPNEQICPGPIAMESERIIYTRAAMRRKVGISKTEISALLSGNANINTNNIMELLKARHATMKDEILQIARASPLGTASATVVS
ncbi:hypothetical protein QLX08_010192 [Tetragonisca angustula]|uniref:HTH cro/C1-type domain-containing protein n=1 Tax=Tetragonisca angustula TaxID=166442 RepID=A0AAW0ZD96_9HYME